MNTLIRQSKLAPAPSPRIVDTLDGALPDGTPIGFGISAKRTRYSGVLAVVSQTEDLGVPIMIDGDEAFRLTATFECRASPTSTFLTVEESTFKVLVIGVNRPLFTLDYHRQSTADVPSAHYNIHAERADMTDALRTAGRRNRGKRKHKMVASGQTPQMGQLHFPRGGHRFRPCLEDILEMLIVEFGVDRKPGAREALAAGRRSWRKFQLKAAISDDPHTAALELQRLGYTFSVVPEGLSERTERTAQI